jgi:ribosome production factor 2
VPNPLTPVLQTPKSTPGHKPLLHFASPLFDTHPRFIQLKQHLIALFNGEAIESIALAGIEHVISIQLSSLPNPAQPLPGQMTDDPTLLPTVHLRTFTLSLKSSSTRVPYIELVPMGPSFDLTLRRFTEPDPVLLAAALKRPKMAKRDVEKGLGDKKKMRNREVDEMGDLRGRIHLDKQDLGGVKRKGVKALKRGWEDVTDEDRDVEMNAGSGGDNGMDVDQPTKDIPRKKLRKG